MTRLMGARNPQHICSTSSSVSLARELMWGKDGDSLGTGESPRVACLSAVMDPNGLCSF